MRGGDVRMPVKTGATEIPPRHPGATGGLQMDDSSKRYLRQIGVVGQDGQASLGKARVLIAGAGGLGCVTATYLALAGVGMLRIVDRDRVEPTNLNRQFLHCEAALGRPKADSAAERLRCWNPGIHVETVDRTIDEDSIGDIADGIDLGIDAADNFALRRILNLAAITRNIPFIHGAVKGFYGQAMTVLPGKSACYQCLFPSQMEGDPPAVLGATCGVIGAIQASEAVKYLTGRGKLLSGRLLIWDGENADMDTVAVERTPSCPACGNLSR